MGNREGASRAIVQMSKTAPQDEATIVELEPTTYVQRRAAAATASMRPKSKTLALLRSSSTMQSDEGFLPSGASPSKQADDEEDATVNYEDIVEQPTTFDKKKKRNVARPGRAIKTVLSAGQLEILTDKTFRAITLKHALFVKPFLDSTKKDDEKLVERIVGYSRNMFRSATDFIKTNYLVDESSKKTYTPEYLYEHDRFATPPQYYDVLPNSHVLFLSPNIILFICRYFYGNYRCIGSQLLLAAQLCHKLNDIFLCFVASVLKMALRCIIFHESYSTEEDETIFVKMLTLWQLQRASGLNGKILEGVGMQIGALANNGNPPSETELTLMVAKATPKGGDTLFTDEQKAQVEATLREMNASSATLLQSYNRITGKRSGKKKT
ncbi:hypothetical protein BJ508DRAFT_326237 [Ascobolus immersus RN42]|uniref:Uncharacterized protein n=1 Tax=Ascobolus immersus RN42 TaxID=1160509 RepID=A0A3N4I654_ASCIM|nr:hypothetical protein BJ508DRAFT_326237 [Ascobolus immersus RN42]